VKDATLEPRLNARSFLDTPTLLSVITGGRGSVGGITVLNSELFVVRGWSTHVVSVYNTNDFTFTRNVSITGSSNLSAIVASPRSQSFTDITSQTMSSPTGPWVDCVGDCL